MSVFTFREDILGMPPTCHRDINDMSATCLVSCQEQRLERHVISRQMKLSLYRKIVGFLLGYRKLSAGAALHVDVCQYK